MEKKKWLSERKIGSSDAPAIMGVSHFDTPYQLWEKKVLKKETPDNPAMQYGRDMEPKARAWFEDKMNISLFPVSSLVHPKHDWMTANLDGMDLDRKVLLEIKCPRNLEKDHAFVKKNKKVPDHYYPQVQHQLEVTGLDMAYYMSFDGSEGLIVEVGRDNAYIGGLVEEEEEFYNCWMNQVPPELTERDYVLFDENKEWLEAAQEWNQIQKSLEYLETKKEYFRSRFINMAANRNAKGAGIRVTKSVSRGLVDYKKIPELQGLDLEPYRKPSYTKWTVTGELTE